MSCYFFWLCYLEHIQKSGLFKWQLYTLPCFFVFFFSVLEKDQLTKLCKKSISKLGSNFEKISGLGWGPEKVAKFFRRCCVMRGKFIHLPPPPPPFPIQTNVYQNDRLTDFKAFQCYRRIFADWSMSKVIRNNLGGLCCNIMIRRTLLNTVTNTVL